MLKKPLQKAESPAKKSGWKGISFKTKSHKRQSSTASFQSQESQASFESSSSSKPENSIHANDKRESSTKISEKGHSEKAATQLQNAPAVITNDSQYDSSDTPSLPVEEATVHRIQNNTPEKQLAPSGRSSMNEIESINEAFEGEFEREPSVKNIAKVFSQDTAFDSTFDSLWHEKTGIDATAEIEALGIRSVSSYPPSFAEETHQEPTTTSTEAKITQPDLVPISEKEEIFIHAEANSEEEEVISPTHQPKELIPLEETYKADMENKTDKTDKDTLEETSHFPEFITDEILPAHKRSDTTETSDLFSGFDMAHSPTIKNSSGLVVSDAFDMMFFSSKKTDSERMEESAVLTPVSTIEETEETDIATITTKSIDGGISILPKELGDENTVEDSQHLGEAKEDQHTTVEKEGSTSDSDNDQDHLGSVLPEIADSIRIQDAYTNKPLPIIDHEAISKEESMAAGDKAMKHPIEEPVDLDVFADNVAAIKEVDVRSIPINDLSPQKQAKADEQVEQGMHFLFDNQFMKAKTIFQKRDRTDPLYALGLGSMAFIKAIMTYNDNDINRAMESLTVTHTIAKTQVDNTLYKRSSKTSMRQYLFFGIGATGLPVSPMPSLPSKDVYDDTPCFIPNGVLRAHVVKAECCLMMAILHMTKESGVGYLKCGLNLRRAYSSYSIVWQEYRRMGQEYNQYMDPNTVSGIQFGIGTFHLLLSSMPAKVLKIFSTFGWKGDKQLGFALLKLCLEGQGLRAPLASLALLTYYTLLTQSAPQLYGKALLSSSVECLMDAQKTHPNSCFFLFFAAHTARAAHNLPLSSQSFNYATDSSRGEWAEIAVKQMSEYEIGLNMALEMKWEEALKYFQQLSQDEYWSPVFLKYFVGACYEMLGERTEAILAFAQVQQLAKQHPNQKTYLDAYILKKLEFFQKSGYQDMDFSLPGLELFLTMNAFEYMEKEHLETALEKVNTTLEKIYEREKIEYTIRLRELVPTATPPDYYDQRSTLLLIKSSILNTLKRHTECISHLNWIIDHKEYIKHETWVLPFAYWESGITSWGLGHYQKGRYLWQLGLSCTKHDFEYRMAVRLSLALGYCDDNGIEQVDTKAKKGLTSNGRKRMPIAPL